MARVVIDDACDACWTKDKTARTSDVDFTLDGRTWFLCAEHEKTLSLQFVGMLGDPNEEDSE